MHPNVQNIVAQLTWLPAMCPYWFDVIDNDSISDASEGVRISLGMLVATGDSSETREDKEHFKSSHMPNSNNSSIYFGPC